VCLSWVLHTRVLLSYGFTRDHGFTAAETEGLSPSRNGLVIKGDHCDPETPERDARKSFLSVRLFRNNALWFPGRFLIFQSTREGIRSDLNGTRLQFQTSDLVSIRAKKVIV